jgi:hypothetical protein
MTWKEFKEFLEKKGVRDEDIIDCIDVNEDIEVFEPDVTFFSNKDGRSFSVEYLR